MLYELLHDADFGKVVATLKAQSVQKIAIAAIFVDGRLRHADLLRLLRAACDRPHKVPYAVAALASFTSFTIGHSLGAAVLTGGLIRFRIYSAWGLTVLDIAKIAFITSMTFWLGNAFLLGGATTYAPEAAAAVDHLPLWINRMIGLSALVRDRLLSALAGAAAARDRPFRMADRIAQSALHARADRDRCARSDPDQLGDVLRCCRPILRSAS